MTNENPTGQENTAQSVFEFLEANEITFERCDHPAVYTCEEADRIVPDLPGTRTKNLFLRDRKGRRHFLAIVRPEQKIDLKALADQLAVDRLSMASPERLEKHLGVSPGAVSLLALLHDTAGSVEVLVERTVWAASHLLIHPMVNTSTLVLAHEEVQRILEITGHEASVITVPERMAKSGPTVHSERKVNE
ncbi:MAG: prolyl-tRNA synthetase associated domain-containing protein [Xanthomonadales bacterium]|jgi:Ala-tRNA(Pro) deacylase|nr:prolyl-tRNA synthetase associated domain-containing protein [Xanthomonadales bacterium]